MDLHSPGFVERTGDRDVVAGVEPSAVNMPAVGGPTNGEVAAGRSVADDPHPAVGGGAEGCQQNLGDNVTQNSDAKVQADADASSAGDVSTAGDVSSAGELPVDDEATLES
jgi:hypothetical protein